MKKVVLLTALEYSGENSYFANHLIPLLPEDGYNYTIISILRIKDFIRYRHNKVQNIKIFRIPVILPLRSKNFYLSFFYIFPFILCSLPKILITLKYLRPDFIHFRNYPAGLLAYIVKKITGIPYIASLPGKYPEDGISSHIWKKESISYKLWKRIEYNIIKNAHTNLAVSEPHKIEIKELGGVVTVIPPVLDIKRFGTGIQKKEYTFCHLGTFSSKKDILNIKKLIEMIENMEISSNTLILTSYPYKPLKDIFGNFSRYITTFYIYIS